MGQYSIKQLELVSGIKAHTIRIWEKRYKLFTPQRTETNIRKYTDIELRLLLNVAFLLHQGFKISKIAQKSHDELNNLVYQQTKDTYDNSFNFEMLLFNTISFNEKSIRTQIQGIIDEVGLEKTFTKVIIPLMNRIGILWQSGMLIPAHEHMVSNIVKQFLINSTFTLPEITRTYNPIVFFLPEGELHEISLLYYNYLAKKEGLNTIYLGQTTPLVDILSLSDKLTPSAFFTSITTNLVGFDFVEFFNSIKNKYRNSEIFATGYAVEKENDKLPIFVNVISSPDLFQKAISKIPL